MQAHGGGLIELLPVNLPLGFSQGPTHASHLLSLACLVLPIPDAVAKPQTPKHTLKSNQRRPMILHTTTRSHMPLGFFVICESAGTQILVNHHSPELVQCPSTLTKFATQLELWAGRNHEPRISLAPTNAIPQESTSRTLKAA